MDAIFLYFRPDMMLQRSFGWLFLALYVVALLRPVAPYLDYFINQEYIAEVLCINKDKPYLLCQGQCHLMMELNEVQDTPDDPDLPAVPIKVQDYPIGFVQFAQVDAAEADLATHQTPYHSSPGRTALHDIFHPPQMA
ncbi:MAG: hypothetical protein AAGB22_01220 [Bacteroidota bacterium]